MRQADKSTGMQTKTSDSHVLS